uniref:Uncharacterized protein n=1 Tax=Arundo donax TaxID=35708 RepID=A0A0A8ZP84_ARUDO
MMTPTAAAPVCPIKAPSTLIFSICSGGGIHL